MITLSEFVSKYKGKLVDFDNAYGGQCVDLYRQYVKEVLGLPQTPTVAGAKDIWNGATNGFDKIANTPDGFPLPGDVMIWGSKYGPYGHVAIATEANTSTFTCFSQNDPSGSLCVIKTYSNWTPLLGWLHPIKVEDSSYKGYDLTNTDSMKVAVDVLIQLQSGELVRKADLDNLSKQINDLRTNHDSLTKRVDDLSSVIAEKDKLIASGEERIATLMADNQTMAEQLVYYKPYKSRYEEALGKIPNAMTASQLFSAAWKKWWEDKRQNEKKTN